MQQKENELALIKEASERKARAIRAMVLYQRAKLVLKNEAATTFKPALRNRLFGSLAGRQLTLDLGEEETVKVGLFAIEFDGGLESGFKQTTRLDGAGIEISVEGLESLFLPPKRRYFGHELYPLPEGSILGQYEELLTVVEDKLGIVRKLPLEMVLGGAMGMKLR